MTSARCSRPFVTASRVPGRHRRLLRRATPGAEAPVGDRQRRGWRLHIDPVDGAGLAQETPSALRRTHPLDRMDRPLAGDPAGRVSAARPLLACAAIDLDC